mmetsp:Transcript_12854/g.34615  ORF Transcript_12854/g.34615 Transcript_12854/m.34615 type:complete len:97 (+) Transcript_12854:260-550(+)
MKAIQHPRAARRGGAKPTKRTPEWEDVEAWLRTVQDSPEERRARFARRWNFDIDTETPLEGKFEWKHVADASDAREEREQPETQQPRPSGSKDEPR